MCVGLPCQPFGPTIQCTCDNRGKALRCLPVVELTASFSHTKQEGENDNWKSFDLDSSVFEKNKSKFNIDQRTEIILAFTLLVIIILSFIL